MRLTVSFHDKRDADILEYIGSDNRLYKIKEAIRKAIHFDNLLERAFICNVHPDTQAVPEIIQSTESTTPKKELKKEDITSDKQPELSEDELSKKIDQF